MALTAVRDGGFVHARAGVHSVVAWPTSTIRVLGPGLHWLSPWLGALAISTAIALGVETPLLSKFDELSSTSAARPTADKQAFADKHWIVLTTDDDPQRVIKLRCLVSGNVVGQSDGALSVHSKDLYELARATCDKVLEG